MLEDQQQFNHLNFFCRDKFLLDSINKKDEYHWWKGVEHVMNMLIKGRFLKIEEAAMSTELYALGFDNEAITRVFEWIETAEQSGNLFEIISMINPPRKSVRVHDPLEKVCVPIEILEKIESLRRRGFLSEGLSERLLEGVRCADARDWDHDDINAFLKDMTGAALDDSNQNLLSGVITKKNPKDLLS